MDRLDHLPLLLSPRTSLEVDSTISYCLGVCLRHEEKGSSCQEWNMRWADSGSKREQSRMAAEASSSCDRMSNALSRCDQQTGPRLRH